jgi:uncharacterized SAM-binding protein YcdF (DUF218 family)
MIIWGHYRQWAIGLGGGCALGLGLFTLLNAVGEGRQPGFDATLWWIDLRGWSDFGRLGLLLVLAILLLQFALFGLRCVWLQTVLILQLLLLAAVCGVNAWNFWNLLRAGEIQSSFPMPFSLFVCGILIALALAAAWSPLRLPWNWLRAVGLLCGIVICGLLFPLGQMWCFGSTDYRRPADLIVVFGCGVYSDGTPSQALSDRVRTAAELYREGYARRMFLSGGPGEGSVHETAAMRKLAIDHGVAADDIVLDPQGLSTEETVRNAVLYTDVSHETRILAVSHFYHLPRVKLCFHRHGAEVYTVPAREEYRLRGIVKYMAREVLALQWYYVAPAFDAANAAQ